MSASAAYLQRVDCQRGASGSVFPSSTTFNNNNNNGAKSTAAITTSWHPMSRASLTGFVSKYQNRRSQLLKAVNPMRSPISISRVRVKTSILTKTCRLKIYDIVSVVDLADNKSKFYGQINAFVTDSYARNYVFLVWLVPKFGREENLNFLQQLRRESDKKLFQNNEENDAIQSSWDIANSDLNNSDKHRDVNVDEFDDEETKFKPTEYVHGIADERPIPAECCLFESRCPLLPRYMRTWSPGELAREQRRATLVARIAELRATFPGVALSNPRNDFRKAPQ